MSQAVLDADAFTQALAPARRSRELAQPLLKDFVLGDPHLSAARGAAGALVAELASMTGVGGKADRRAQVDGLDLAGGARDGHPLQVEPEVRLRIEVAVLRHPRLADNEAAVV